MRRRLLVADDSSTIQKVIKIAFARFAVDIVEAVSLIEALSALGQDAPDAFIVDASLPGTRGPQDFIKLRGNGAKAPPVLLLVGTYEAVDEAAFRQAGFQHVLKKPFESADIIAAVERLLGGSLVLASEALPPLEGGTNSGQRMPTASPPPTASAPSATSHSSPFLAASPDRARHATVLHAGGLPGLGDLDKLERAAPAATLPPPPPVAEGRRGRRAFATEIPTNTNAAAPQAAQASHSVPPVPFTSPFNAAAPRTNPFNAPGGAAGRVDPGQSPAGAPSGRTNPFNAPGGAAGRGSSFDPSQAPAGAPSGRTNPFNAPGGATQNSAGRGNSFDPGQSPAGVPSGRTNPFNAPGGGNSFDPSQAPAGAPSGRTNPFNAPGQLAGGGGPPPMTNPFNAPGGPPPHTNPFNAPGQIAGGAAGGGKNSAGRTNPFNAPGGPPTLTNPFNAPGALSPSHTNPFQSPGPGTSSNSPPVSSAPYRSGTNMPLGGDLDDFDQEEEDLGAMAAEPAITRMRSLPRSSAPMPPPPPPARKAPAPSSDPVALATERLAASFIRANEGSEVGDTAAELPTLVRQAVEDYCERHFKSLAREIIAAELRRLADEKARHLVDH